MIKSIKLSTVLNSKNKESLKVTLFTEKGNYFASVPSGTSKGIHEAVELPIKTVSDVFETIKKYFIAVPEDYRKVDMLLKEVDKTNNFSKIGVNLALALSLATARANFKNELYKIGEKYNEFPFHLSNIIGGGKHGGGCDWQEFLVLPYKSNSVIAAVKQLEDFWNFVGKELKEKKLLIGRNLENAWMLKLDDIKTLDFISDVSANFDLKLGIDFAASSFWNGKKYVYKKLNRELNPDQQIDFITEIAKRYGLYYLEDPMHEDDFESFSVLMKQLKKCFIVGDDLYCTNPARLKMGINMHSSNGITIKPNQIGTLSQTQKVVDIARKNKIVSIAAHRSGETKDYWLADLALAWSCPIIKIGVFGFDEPKSVRLVELWKKIKNAKMAKLPI